MSFSINHNEVVLLTDSDINEGKAYINKILFQECAKTPTFKPLLKFPQRIGVRTMDKILHPLLPYLNFTNGPIYEGVFLSYTYQADQEHSAWQTDNMPGFAVGKGTLSEIILRTVKDIQHYDRTVKIYLGTNQQHELTIAYGDQLQYLHTESYRILADQILQRINAYNIGNEVFAANIMKYGKPLLCTLNPDDDQSVTQQITATKEPMSLFEL